MPEAHSIRGDRAAAIYERLRSALPFTKSWRALRSKAGSIETEPAAYARALAAVAAAVADREADAPPRVPASIAKAVDRARAARTALVDLSREIQMLTAREDEDALALLLECGGYLDNDDDRAEHERFGDAEGMDFSRALAFLIARLPDPAPRSRPVQLPGWLIVSLPRKLGPGELNLFLAYESGRRAGLCEKLALAAVRVAFRRNEDAEHRLSIARAAQRSAAGDEERRSATREVDEAAGAKAVADAKADDVVKSEVGSARRAMRRHKLDVASVLDEYLKRGEQLVVAPASAAAPRGASPQVKIEIRS